MLRLFRKSQRPLLWILLILIIIVFIWFYGQGGGNMLATAKSKPVGQIGEKVVTEDDLGRAIRGVIVYLQLFAGYPPELLAQSDAMEQEGWRRLIEVEQAKKEGITVSKDEVRRTIENALFGRPGAFDPDAYRAIVAKIGGRMPPREFEEHIRDTLLIEKVRRCLASTVVVTDEDLRQAYDVDNTLIKIAYVPFPYTNYIAGQVVTTNEVEEFFYTHQEDFRVPPQVDISFALVADAPEKVTLTDEELSDYYEDNEDEFAITNVLPVADGSTNELETAEVQEFRQFDDVKEEIREQLTEQRAQEIAYDTLEQLYFAMSGVSAREVAERVSSFQDEARKLGISTLETGWLALEDPIPGVTNTYEIVRAAFGMRPGENSDVIRIPDLGYLLFIVEEQRESYLPELAEMGNEVREEIERRRAIDAARLAATQLKNKIARSTNSFVDAVQSLGYKPRTTVPLDRNTGIREIGCPAEIVGKMFAFPENTAVVIPSVEGYMLASPVVIYPADYTLMYTQIDELKNRIAREQQGLLFNSWLMQAARNVRMTQEPAEEEEEGWSER